MEVECLIVSDGTKGMENQSIALSKLMKLNFQILTIKPSFILRIFPKLAIYFDFIFVNEKKYFNNFKFKYLITTGKRTSGYSILAKKIFGKKIINIHIQNPKINLTNFDILLTPDHDKVFGKNVFKFEGSLSFFNEKDIKKSYNLIKKELDLFKKPLIFLLIGGDNKRYKLTYSEYCKFLLDIKLAVEKISGTLVISPSRRTPEKVGIIIREIFNSSENFYLMKEEVKNFYPGILQIANYVLITSDSINMISEVATTKVNLFVYHLRQEKNKILKFHQSFENKIYIKRFTGDLFNYNKKQLLQNNLIKKKVLSYIKKNLSK